MKPVLIYIIIGALLCAISPAQSSSDTTVAPGSSLPGLGGLSLGMEGPGYVEIGGGHSDLSGPYTSWNDFYARGMLSGGRNVLNGELGRQERFGDIGWFYGLGLTRNLSESWYAQVSAGGSVGGFFLPRYRVSGLINHKLLHRRQLVMSAGVGFDQSKTVNNDLHGEVDAAYYFEYPIVVQGGMMWTHSNPGNILARTQYLAATQGHEKEHYLSLRYEWGREGYEVVGLPANGSTPGVLFDFPQHTISGSWRQWIGPNWGVNFIIEQHQEPSYHRWGGTGGVFLDF